MSSPDVVEALRVQADHGHRPAGQLVGGGADLVQVLGDNHLWVELGQQVDVVDEEGSSQQLAHRPVQRPARPAGREPGAGQRRQLGHLGRVVALVGDPTSSSPAPRAQMISVADGSSDTTRKLHLRIIDRAAASVARAPVGHAKAA
jgi:hypothetical protein